MAMNRIYLDHAATTAVLPEVLEAMLPYFCEHYGNASSLYGTGRDARKAMEIARCSVAEAIHAEPEEIYFTSGGSESDNWALRSVLLNTALCRRKNVRIVTSAIEHHAILNTGKVLQEEGVQFETVPVDSEGIVHPEVVAEHLDKETDLVSVMMANNEIGTIEPVSEIGEIARAKNAFFHTDAVQAIGAVPIDVKAMNIDMLSLSAHKFGGPKGVGALYVRRGVKPAPFLFGGAQERNRRAGTENIPGIVGLGVAIQIAVRDLERNMTYVRTLRDQLLHGLLEQIPGIRVNGSMSNRLPGNINILIPGIDRERFLAMLDLAGIAVSGGSACASGSLEPSHVLRAIGVPYEDIFQSVRITLGPDNTHEDIEYTLRKFVELIPHN